MITVRTTDPVAYYLETCGYSAAATFASAKNKCRTSQAEYENDSLKNGALNAEPGCDCENHIAVINGPYQRHWAVPKSYDDIEVFRYLNPIDGQWFDGLGEQPCFAAGTPILTPNGRTAIETLSPGDTVIAWEETTGQKKVARITHTKQTPFQEVGTLILSDGRRLSVTRNHPFYVVDEARWRTAEQLKPAMPLLVYEDDKTKTVYTVSIRFGRMVDVVYNLSVDGPHTYFANGVLVHNY